MEITERLSDDHEVTDAARAAATIPADATLAVSGFGSVGYPKEIPLALANDDRDLSLSIISGGSVGNEIDTALVEADAISRRYTYQARTASREAVNDRQIAFQDRHIARLGEDVLLGHLPKPNVAIVEAIAVGDGWFVPSTSIGQTRAFVEAADRLIVEINYEQPLSLQAFHDVYRVGLPPRSESIPLSSPGERIGNPMISFEQEKLEAVVETNVRDQPYEFRDPTPVDEAIAENLTDFLKTECTQNPAMAERIHLQFGVGGLGNALMGAFRSVDFGGRDIVYYGEVIQDGLLDMLDAGKLEVASATSFALSEEGQDRLFDNAERYAKNVILRPASLSNRPELVDKFGVVSVNSALEVDLYGHANSTHINGSQIVNGIGGSGDFTRNGQVSVIALSSTAADGSISRIVPMVPHVDHTEHDFGIVVTEHGVADLRALSPRECAEVLVDECADPTFRDDLSAYLKRADCGRGHIPHDLESVFTWTTNT
ncbi:acetyl-CoA hydrolase/transferase C-terminal domain-containing protein [Natronosalvus halobius]|uniref:acetyl-CoA hydrolase/transferase C-terminal domain-containing protein n=1 Tax=Natronosalvus halobius TaxID=2953746 RepID=UPI0020A0F030|nr:acetyl-CoA hydrolase/transferase C-terminal domain-containing protein [Natronosalvus halobius]USZ73573.1 acetyl-CoA hydrolase [Natronosalvus halobius]